MTRGFTTLFAVLIASLLLSVGLAIFEITLRQVSFAQIVRDSDAAIYAADSGAECALYWDFKCSLSNCLGAAGASAFSTSSDSRPPSTGVMCNNQDVAQNGTPPVSFGAPPTGWTVWDIQNNASAATTTFWLSLPSGTGRTYCASVTVAKWGNPTNTVVVSRGYNTCSPGDPNRIERALQVTY